MSNLAYAQQHRALIISGGGADNTIDGSAPNSPNFLRYYNNVDLLNASLNKNGIKTENIIAGGGSNGFYYNTSTKKVEKVPYDFNKDSIPDDLKSASNENINNIVNELIKSKEGSDSHLTIFITDHGKKPEGVVLWNGETLSKDQMGKVLEQLAKAGITTHIVTNMCFGGQLVDESDFENGKYCIMANSSPDIPTHSDGNSDLFAQSFARQIFEGEKTVFESFNTALKDDNLNKEQRNSLGVFLKKNVYPLQTESLAKSDCSSLFSGFEIFDELVTASLKIASNNGDTETLETNFGTRTVPKSLLSELQKVQANLGEEKMIKLRTMEISFKDSIKKNIAIYNELMKKYNSASNSQVMEAKAQIDSLLLRLQGIENTIFKDHYRKDELINELNLIRNADNETYAKYLNVRKCLDYKIPKISK